MTSARTHFPVLPCVFGAALLLALAAMALLERSWWPQLSVASALLLIALLLSLRKRQAPAMGAPRIAPTVERPIEIEGDLTAGLYIAARTGQSTRALELLNAGADPHALPPAHSPDQRSLLALATVLPDPGLLRALIARGLDPNQMHAGMNALIAATRDSWHGRADAVMTLLSNGADPRLADADGNTPLHHAARSSDPAVAALLCDAGADLQARNHDGVTPLGMACAAGNWRLAKFLIEHGAHPDTTHSAPALLSAAATDSDDPAGIELLLRHKARVNSRDAHGRSALHEAARHGHVGIIQTLLNAGADASTQDNDGQSPLLEAARGGHLDALNTLLDAHPELRNTVDAHGRNALMHACLAERPALPVVQRLLDAGITPDHTDHAGHSAVDHAIAAGHWALVKHIDPAYPLPASVSEGDNNEHAPLDRLRALLRTPGSALEEVLNKSSGKQLLRSGMGCKAQTEGLADASARICNTADHPNPQMNATRGLVQTFLDACLPLAALLDAEQLGQLLLDADISAHPAHIHWLLAQGANPNIHANDGRTPLNHLIERLPASLAAVQALLQHDNVHADSASLTRLLHLCLRGAHTTPALEQCALDLIHHGATPQPTSIDVPPPLTQAIRLGWNRLLEHLAQAGVDLNARDRQGLAAIHIAAALGRESSLRLLLRYGAAITLRTQDGQTPLGIALAAGHRALAQWLDWRDWQLPNRALRPDDVPAAAAAGDGAATLRLIDLGLPVDARDEQGCTALLRAAGGGHLALAQALIERGANLNHSAHSGATPLSAAISMAHTTIISALLQAGADLNHRLPGELSVLMLAAACGQPAACRQLLEAGADIHASNPQGLSALHCAARYGFTATQPERLRALLAALLDAGASPDARSLDGLTPLLLLLGATADPGHRVDESVLEPALGQLLDAGAGLDAQDAHGVGPLHLTALHGLPQITRLLLRAGADPELRDQQNRPPRAIAIARGFIDIATELTPTLNRPGISMARFLGAQGVPGQR